MSLGVTGRFGLLIRQTATGAAVVVDTFTDYYGTYYSYDYVYREYWRAIPVAYVGLEPRVALGGGFALYTGFGVRAVFVPDSKYIDETDPDFDGAGGHLPLTQADDYRRVEFSGLTIGVRLRF